MAAVILPRSLVALFPDTERRRTVGGASVGEVIAGLDVLVPGMAARLVTTGPAIREHLNVFVDGERATLATPVGPGSIVHVIPAISGG